MTNHKPPSRNAWAKRSRLALVLWCLVLVGCPAPALADAASAAAQQADGIFTLPDTYGVPLGNYGPAFGSGLRHEAKNIEENGITAPIKEPAWEGLFLTGYGIGVGVLCAGIWLLGYFGRLSWTSVLDPILQRLDIAAHTLQAQFLPVLGVFSLAMYAMYIRHSVSDGTSLGRKNMRTLLIAGLMGGVLADPLRLVQSPAPWGAVADAKLVGDYASSMVSVAPLPACTSRYKQALESPEPFAVEQLAETCGRLGPEQAEPNNRHIENFLGTAFVRDFTAWLTFNDIPELVSARCGAAYTLAEQKHTDPREAIKANCGARGKAMYAYSESATTGALGRVACFVILALLLFAAMLVLTVRTVVTFFRIAQSAFKILFKGISAMFDGEPVEEFKDELREFRSAFYDFAASDALLAVFGAATRLVLGTNHFDSITGMLVIAVLSIACASLFLWHKGRHGQRARAFAGLFGARARPTYATERRRQAAADKAQQRTQRRRALVKETAAFGLGVVASHAVNNSGRDSQKNNGPSIVTKLATTAAMGAAKSNPALFAVLQGANASTRAYAR